LTGAAPRLEAPTNEEDPRPDTAWWGVHAARYAFAVRNLEFTRLLDVACGSGYGLSMLAAEHQQVIGVDVDRDALRSASQAAPVLAADGCALPFDDGTFDAISSFETIEHLDHRDAFLAELARVLAPDGTLVLSTPNAVYTQPVNGRPRNPFHVFEYTPEELLAALRRHFGDVRMLGQEIDPRFSISPFWDDQQKLPKPPLAQARLLVWRVLNKVPPGKRDVISNLLWGHPLFPAENDYVFSEELVPTARVLVALATAPRAAPLDVSDPSDRSMA